MKITKEYLRNIIKESIEETMKQELGKNDESANDQLDNLNFQIGRLRGMDTKRALYNVKDILKGLLKLPSLDQISRTVIESLVANIEF